MNQMITLGIVLGVAVVIGIIIILLARREAEKGFKKK